MSNNTHEALPVTTSYTVTLPEAGPVQINCATWTGQGDLRLLLVHGLGHNRLIWTPMVEALLADHGDLIREIVAIDLPGHGGSSMPQAGYPFGKLNLHQYAVAVRGALEGLPAADGAGFDVLVGHSMGGLITMILAQALAAAGGTLSDLGVRGVALLAPTMPDPLPWAFAEGLLTEEGLVSPMLLKLLPYIQHTPELWFYAEVNAQQYRELFYTNPEGSLAAGAPTLAQASVLKDLEAYSAAAQMGGIDLRSRAPLERPYIQEGLLAGLATVHVAYAADAFMRVEEQASLAAWLNPVGQLVTALGEDAVHCALWSQPADTVAAVASLLGQLDVEP